MDEGTPEVEVAIDRFKTSYYNVTVESIINQVKSYLSGSSAGSFEKDGEMKDITIKLGDLTLHQLRDLMITAGNVKVPLSELAVIKNSCQSEGNNKKKPGKNKLYICKGECGSAFR